MKKQVKISIPEPCKEQWGGMKPVGSGRHCEKCDRAIADFSRLSDGQLLDLLAKQNGQLCGRISSVQLNRPLIQPKEPYHRTFDLRMVLLGLGILCCTPLFGATESDASISLIEITASQRRISTEDSLLTKDTVQYFRIQLVDAETLEPLFYEKIILYDVNNNIVAGAICDFDGLVTLQIAGQMASRIDYMKIGSESGEYNVQTIPWETFQTNPIAEIALVPLDHGTIMMGIIITEPVIDVKETRPSFTWKRTKPGQRD